MKAGGHTRAQSPSLESNTNYAGLCLVEIHVWQSQGRNDPGFPLPAAAQKFLDLEIQLYHGIPQCTLSPRGDFGVWTLSRLDVTETRAMQMHKSNKVLCIALSSSLY